MSTEIQLSPIVNQTFSVALNGHNFDFRFRTFRKILFVSVQIDKTYDVVGVKAVPGHGILPGVYAAMVGGNFVFRSTDGDYPHYTLFDGSACRLFFEEA